MGGIYGITTIYLPLSWLVAIATSDLRLAIYSMRVLYGVTRYLHLVGTAVFVGMVFILDLRGMGLFPQGALDAARTRLLTVLTWSFWITVGTGVLLFLRDPVGVGLHSMFLPKLLLVLFGYLFAKLALPSRTVRGSEGRRRAAAMLSMAVWLLVIGASTWNHVERPVRIGEQLRLQNIGK